MTVTSFHCPMFMTTDNHWHYFLFLLFPHSDSCPRHCAFLMLQLTDCSVHLITTVFLYESQQPGQILFDILFPLALLALLLTWAVIPWQGSFICTKFHDLICSKPGTLDNLTVALGFWPSNTLLTILLSQFPLSWQDNVNCTMNMLKA